MSRSLRTVWLGCLGLAACTSPAAGQWRGTADLGPVAAYAMELKFAEDGSSGSIVVHEPGKPFTDQHFQLCSVQLDDRAITMVYDAARPDCASQGAASDRRTLRGTVGEDVVFGEMFRGEGARVDDNTAEKLGFFRTFRIPEPPAAPAETTPPKS